MTWDYDGWIIVIGILVAACCAIPGSWLVVRGMGMMGDAIAHAVLPGIALGFLLSGTRSSSWMFAGAAVSGVLAAVMTQWVHRFGRVERGAAMGLVFTSFFAFGILLMVQTANHVELDAHSVLYGAIELAPLDTETIAGVGVPRIILPLVMVLLLNVLVVVLFFKESLMTAFDPGLARAQGIRPQWMQYGLMVLTAATCVACFEAVGSIMTVTFLVAPAAAAMLLVRRMWSLLLWAISLGAVATTLGHLSAITVPSWFFGAGMETSTSGMMAVSAAAIFLIVAAVAPRRGMVARWWVARRDAARVALEDALGLLFRLEERGVSMALHEVEALWGSDVRIGPRLGRVKVMLQRRMLAHVAVGQWHLTDQGRAEARHLVRAHRLWETYLAGHSSIPISHLHAAAERLEHVTDEAMAAQLRTEVGPAEADPHGRSIPPSPEQD